MNATRGPIARQRGASAACAAVAIACFGVICAPSPGPVKQIAGLALISAFACAVWFLRRGRFDVLVPAAGLTLTFLILAGLALAAGHALNTVPVALATAIGTLAASWFGASSPTSGAAERGARHKALNPLATIGVLIFAAAAVLAVHHSAASAATDADSASSVAIWAYPSGGQLHVGVTQPAGRGAASLRIVVTQAGLTVATWNDIHLAPGQSWEAPALTVTGPGPARVVVLRGGTVVASLSSQ